MPVEYVNYTITSVNGALWAKIDGYYPISIVNESSGSFSGDLPMVYPMPPQTTNIHVWLGEEELSWSNCTQLYSEALHHTALGNWWMIYSVLANVSGSFVLKIHYEHPLEMINGSYLFLYDLNISPYLSEENNNSTAYFTVRMDTNTTALQAYTTETDTKWNPINFTTTKEGNSTVASITIFSQYGKPLQGDLVVIFSTVNQVPEYSTWGILVLATTLSIMTVILAKIKIISVREKQRAGLIEFSKDY
ncbi:MAG: hypothetical protein M1167_00985 [Chloroflexi bacterium]|nr:hypothetical protein [Chloroflexota bacterium]